MILFMTKIDIRIETLMRSGEYTHRVYNIYKGKEYVPERLLKILKKANEQIYDEMNLRPDTVLTSEIEVDTLTSKL